MVEVFKTNVHERRHAEALTRNLLQQFPLLKVNFDLEDCDKILRVEGKNIQPDPIIELVNGEGYQCNVLVS
jgi:hypothetical protein